MADKRCIPLFEAEHGDRSSVGGEAARDDIQLGRAEFEQLLALGGINGSGGAVALLVSDEQKIARPSDAAGQNGGIQRDLRLDRGRIRQNRILAAAVIDQNIGLAGLHDRIGIADRHLKRRHAARTGKIKRVAVCVGETGLEQRTIAENIVFEFYVRDVALMLARTGERVLHRALNGRRREQTIMGQYKAERADCQQPAADKAQLRDKADARIAALFQADTAVFARCRKADEISYSGHFFVWCVTHQGSPPHYIAFRGVKCE